MKGSCLLLPALFALTLNLAPTNTFADDRENVALMIHVVRAQQGNACTDHVPASGDGVVTLADADEGGARLFGVILASPIYEDEFRPYLAGMQFALEYPPVGTPGGGVNIVDWTSCGDLEFPQDDWLEPGAGNTITWVAPENCQVDEITIGGILYISAYAPSTLSIVPYNKTGKIKVANCRAAEIEIELPMAQVGWVSFGGAAKGTDTDGCNPLLTPCNSDVTPVISSTWGRIKAQYGEEN